MGNAREQFYAALDVGTTKVVTLVGKANPSGSLEIVAEGYAPSVGMRKGMVVSPEAVRESVAASVRQAEKSLKRKIPPVVAGLTGSHLKSHNSDDPVTFPVSGLPSNGHFTESSGGALQSQARLGDSIGMRVVQEVPRGSGAVSGDGSDASGAFGKSGAQGSHIVMGDIMSVDTLLSTIRSAGVQVHSLALEHLASSEAVLTSEERLVGVILADIGGGSTDIAAYREGSVWLTGSIPVAGQHFTNDVAAGLGTPPNAAERLKLLYGSTRFEEVDAKETVAAQSGPGGHARPVHRKTLNRLLHDRAVELVRLLMQRLASNGVIRIPSGGVVLTGGSAALPGLSEIVADYGKCSVRIGVPSSVWGLPEELSNAAYSTSVGLLLWAIRQRNAARAADRKAQPVEASASRSGGWLARLMGRQPAGANA